MPTEQLELRISYLPPKKAKKSKELFGVGGLICEKWGATYGRNGCLGGEIKYLVVGDKDDREGFTWVQYEYV